MNLLAYGGTAFTERQRIGDWPSGLDGALQDKYGLAGESLSFGFGRRDGRCFLIVRQRQNISNRGGYAYTLLLDPGEDLWKEFEWNAALLLQVLFGSTDAPGGPLLTEPEKIGKKLLAEILAKAVAPSIDRGDESAMETARTIWTAGLVFPKPLAFAPADVGPPERPTMLWMAQMIAGLPVAFRRSAGWLVGGGDVLAGAFGAQIALDDKAVTCGPALDALGTSLEYWPAWKSLAADPSYSSDIAAWEVMPAWQWTDPPSLVLERVAQLSRYLADPVRTDADYEAVGAPDFDDGPLAARIHEVVTRTTMNGNAPLTEKATLYLLSRCLDHSQAIPAAVVSRMEPIALEHELRRRRLRPWNTPGLEWKKEDLVPVLEISMRAEEPAAVAGLLKDILHVKSLVAADHQRLANVAVERLEDWTGSLEPWFAIRLDERTGPVLRPKLAEVARSRIRDNHPDSARDYIVLVDDPGGKDLARGRIAAGFIGSTLLEAIEGKCKEIKPHDAQKWLTALASSPFRRDFEVPLKYKLASKSKCDKKVWAPFATMYDLYYGTRKQNNVVAGPVEKGFLASEFHQLIKSQGNVINQAPYLTEILKLVESILPETLPLIESMRCGVESDRSAVASWIEGLRRIGAKNLATEQKRLGYMTEDSRPPDSRPPDSKSPDGERDRKPPLPRLPPPENLEEILAGLLFGLDGKQATKPDVDHHESDRTGSGPASSSGEPTSAEKPADAVPSGEQPAPRRQGGIFARFRGRSQEKRAVSDEARQIVDPEREEQARKELHEILVRYDGHDRLMQGLHRVITQHIENHGESFSQRFSGHRRTVNDLLLRISPDDGTRLLKCIAHWDDVEFVGGAINQLPRLSDDMSGQVRLDVDPFTRYNRVLVRYLRSLPENADVLKRIGKSIGLDDRVKFQTLLEKLQKYLSPEQAPEAEKESQQKQQQHARTRGKR